MKISRVLPLLTPFLILPLAVNAVDLNKGLQESTENWENRETFLKKNTHLSAEYIDAYPFASYGSRAFARDLLIKSPGESAMASLLKSDKGEYQAGETAQFHLDLDDKGNQLAWGDGNLTIVRARLAQGRVEGDEYLVSLRDLFQDNFLLLDNKKERVQFSWKIPQDTKSGIYEIRVFPNAGDKVVFLGHSGNYRAFISTRIEIKNDSDKEDKVELDANRIALNGKIIGMKKELAVVDTNTPESDTFTIPIKNTGVEARNILIIKRIWAIPRRAESLLDQEEEKITLKPGEEKIIKYEITPEKNLHTAGSIEIRFVDAEEGKNNAGTALAKSSNSQGEGVIFPYTAKGMLTFHIRSAFISRFPLEKGDEFMFLIEPGRSDPLHFLTNGKEREKEVNVKVVGKLTDKDGKLIDEIGYEGPSWDEFIQLSKNVKAKKDYEYIKLTATVHDTDGNELASEEIEYDLSKTLSKPEKKETPEDSGRNIFKYSLLFAMLLIAGYLYFTERGKKRKKK